VHLAAEPKTEVVVAGGVLLYADLEVSMEENRSKLDKYQATTLK
jgi:hypothetical protein